MALPAPIRHVRALVRSEMGLEPPRGMLDHQLKGALLWKQVGCARNDLDCFRRLQARKGLFVELDHAVIESTDDEQGRRGHIVKRGVREIGPASAGDDSANTRAEPRRSDQGRRRSSARSEQTKRQADELWVGIDPMDDINKSSRE